MDLPGSGAVESANRRSSHSTPSIRSMAQRHASGSVDPLRMRVVEILAGTANGCVSELGYQPGTLQKIQTLETLNSQWQAENVRLYEDNRKLLQSIEIQKDHLKYLSADPEANRVKHVQDLEERVRVLTIERTELWKQNQSLLAGKTDPNYRWLQEEYKRLADMYRVAQNEIEHLRGFVRTGAPVPQTYEAAHATRMQGGQPLPAPPPNHQNNRGQGIALPHPTSGPIAGPSMPRRSTGQLFPQPSSQSGAYVQHGLPERHMVQGWHQHQATQGSQGNIIPPRNRPPSLSIPAQVDAQQWNSTPSHHQPSSQVRPTIIPSSGGAPAMTTAQQQALAINSVQTLNRISHPKRTSMETPPASATQQSFPSSYHFVQPGRAPAHMQPPSNSPTIPQSHSQMNATPPGDTAAPQYVANCAITSSPEVALLSMPPTPPNSAKAVSPSSTTDELIMPGIGFAEESRANSLPASPPSRPCLKRTNSQTDLGSGGGDETNKRARVEAAENSDGASAKPPERRADEPAGVPPEEGDEEDVVPVGDDGLRILSDCLDAIFGEDETEEGKICGLCSGRFEDGLTTERPKRFQNATEEQLLEHCTTTHPKAWEAIRRDV